MQIHDILESEEVRRREFPAARTGIFLAHAGVAPLPRAAVEAMADFCVHGSHAAQENEWCNKVVRDTRRSAAELIGAKASEIALIGPTTLGINLVSHGLSWSSGDEVLYYQDDYPANVYPWMRLTGQGVRAKSIEPEYPGVIDWPIIERALTPRTRLVALATCNFLSGYRIDVDTIGRALHERGILFSLDAIQTLGAFPLSVEHVDFLSADSHKWMLGPCGAGIFYVRSSLQDELRPSLLGSWNVVSPQFIAQDEIRFESGGRRYEPGTLNLPGIVGMGASVELLLGVGIQSIGERILSLREKFLVAAREKGYETYLDPLESSGCANDSNRSGIIALTHRRRDVHAVGKRLIDEGISVSLRWNRKGTRLLRVSPHFYNTEDELSRVAGLLA